jgi:hypothetical protein
MILTSPGQPMFAVRKKFSEIVNPAHPVAERRLRITAPTSIRGTPVPVGTVLSFDVSGEAQEDYALLLGCLKAEKVGNDVPLTVPPVPAEAKKK